MAGLMQLVVEMRAIHADSSTHGLVTELGLEDKIRGDGVSVQ